ncbi:hypothetical protein [Acidovorax sp. CCYZU-2555]|uniref:hypothetical protein n=1 Tax=Acidovorax sp. CCYZU-2555 TaxID=2835042 RepID=UPI0020C05576|nr:hypothetical protein [Acidovorax sp. CCYZU-2555]
MNARHPLSYITADPVVGATDFDDDREAEQDAHEAMLAEAEQQTPLIVLAQLQALKQPGDWLRPSISAGALSSPDEILCDAIQHDDASRDAYAELMTSPAAQRLRQSMAEWFGRKHAMAIYTERAAAG